MCSYGNIILLIISTVAFSHFHIVGELPYIQNVISCLKSRISLIQVVYDSLLMPYRVSFGGGAKKGFQEEYRELKNKSGIITYLE